MDLKEGTGLGELQELAQQEQVLLWELRQVSLLHKLALQDKSEGGIRSNEKCRSYGRIHNEESVEVGHFLASGHVPDGSSPWFTSQTGHGEGWGCLGVVSADPSDQGAPKKEREISEVRGRENDLEREGWGRDNGGGGGL
jgi:hypothetical protein